MKRQREDFRQHLMNKYRSDPPFLQFAMAVVFFVRAAFGFFLSYGHPAAAAFSAAIAIVYGALGARRLLSAVAVRRTPASPLRGTLAYFAPAFPFVFASLLSFLDVALTRISTLSFWPIILVFSSFFTPGYEAFALSFLVTVGCDVAAALLFFDGVETVRLLYLIAAAIPIALVTAVANRTERERLFRDAAERIERVRYLSSMRDAEVEIAARIQRTLLLDEPSTSCRGIRVEAVTIASSLVDGDFYGFVPYSGDSVDVLIGDVMGKGVPAALLGAALKNAFQQASLRLLVKKKGEIPRLDDLLSAVHDVVAGELSALESFATLQYARVDAGRSRLDFVDCGHTPILHYDATLNVTWSLKGTDFPIGFTDENTYTRYAIPLAEGDRLLFYSDGVTEAPDGSGEQFGEARLTAIVGANATLDPGELVRRVVNTALFFTSSAGFRDDVTCIAISLDSSSVGARRDRAAFPRHVDSIALMRTYLIQKLSGLGAGQLDRVLLAVSEAATNIIRHGEAAAEIDSPDDFETLSSADDEVESSAPEAPYDSQNIQVELICSHSWMSVRLVYRGAPFAWHVPPRRPDIETMPEGGFGRTLMADSADSVLYASGQGDLQLICLVFETASCGTFDKKHAM